MTIHKNAFIVVANRKNIDYDYLYNRESDDELCIKNENPYKIILATTSSKEEAELFIKTLKGSQSKCDKYYEFSQEDNEAIKKLIEPIRSRINLACLKVYDAWVKKNPLLYPTPHLINVRKKDNSIEHENQQKLHNEQRKIKNEWKARSDQFICEREERRSKALKKAIDRRVEKYLSKLKKPIYKPEYYDLYLKCENNFSDLEVEEI